MRKKSELFFSSVLIPVDFLAFLTAFLLAYVIRVRLDTRPVAYPLGLEFFLTLFLLIAPVMLLIFAIVGLYNQSSRRTPLSEIGKVFVGVSGAFMFVLLLDFFVARPLFSSKLIPMYAYGISIVTVISGRLIVRAIQRTLFRTGLGVYNAVVIGSGWLAAQIVRNIETTGMSGYRIVAVLETGNDAPREFNGYPVYKSLDTYLAKYPNTVIDEIIQADSNLNHDEILHLVEYATANHMVYRFVPNQLGLFTANARVASFAGLPTVELRRTPLDGWGRIIKRLFDFVGAAAGLIILSPLLLFIATCSKLTDPGPVLYKHKRLSRENQVFYVYKFRTMKLAFCTGGAYSGKTDAEIFREIGRPELIDEFKKEQKLKNDPRISNIGQFLRRTSLDELPQLFNILAGTLSIVGPRPIVEAELEKYGKQGSSLLALKPGLTGLWQASGRNDVGYAERVRMDIYYVENWSLWLDIKIIGRTIMSVLKRDGAY